MTTPSVARLWGRYRALHPDLPADPPHVERFGDREDADRLAALIVAGIKRATASALIEYEATGDPIPAPGRLTIVTDRSGEARALIRTIHVSVRRFADVPASFAALEGEGDGSLAWWRKAHAAFWSSSQGAAGAVVDDDFAVVCEEFELLLR